MSLLSSCLPRWDLSKSLCLDSNDIHPDNPAKTVINVRPAAADALEENFQKKENLEEQQTKKGEEQKTLTVVEKSSERKITFLHFNDVYNIEPAVREPVGGAARLAHTVKSFKAENPLVVFSGDAFNPSLLSTVTLGAQMPPVLNAIGVHVACVGNHDLDFGTAQLMKLVKQCKFPWLMANVLDRQTKKPYANALATHIMDWNGVKVGFAGLVEEEWLETLGAVNPEELEYVDFIEEGRRLAQKLKAEGAEILVAITHMRVPNDRKVAAELSEYHLVMGGHDHHYETDFIPPHNVLMVKSGTDFRDLTKVDVILPGPGQKPKITWQRITMDSTVPQDPETEELVNSFMGKMASRMSETIGHSAQDLDGRFNTVRTKESNLGNFICDILRKATDADMVLINGGTFRSDAIHPAGPFTLGDLLSIMPMVDPILVIEATGEQILQGLENGVSMYPKLEGRFPQVSGLSFMFDPDAPPRQRIMSGSILVGGEPLDMKRKYRLGTKGYVADGKDGYDVFKSCQVLVDDEAGPVIPTAIRNHFRYLEVLNKWDPNARIQKFASIWRKNASNDKKLNELGDGAKEDEHELPARHAVPEEGDSSTCLMDGQYCINPAVDGRIMMV